MSSATTTVYSIVFQSSESATVHTVRDGEYSGEGQDWSVAKGGLTKGKKTRLVDNTCVGVSSQNCLFLLFRNDPTETGKHYRTSTIIINLPDMSPTCQLRTQTVAPSLVLQLQRLF